MFSMSIVDSQYRYSTIHPSFYKMWCKKAGHEVQETTAWVSDVAFYFKYNDLWGVIDFADHATRAPDNVKKFPVFKAHYNDNIDYPKNFFPLGPVLTGHRPQPYQLDFLLDNDFEYNPKSDFTCKQRPYAGALERRQHVQSIILEKFPNTDINYRDWAIDFWKKHENKLGAICVPGAVNNMLDRGQAELMMLGVCTISPRLPEILVNNIQLEPNKDYIVCADDYSDLINIMESLSPEKAKEIGDNVKKKMNDNYKPKPFWDYVINTMEKFYG